MIGRTVSHFKITAKIGAGGMGEVYRATDTKLGRDVALKLLPQSVAGDPDRMARFEREAKVLASLNHPNIATLYGLETVDPDKEQTTFLAMELVEGEDLSERIGRGPIPFDEAIPIALQIAEALEAAHDQGIVHRDLKPANIKVSEDGEVKVLDFGLAKEWATKGVDSAASTSPTRTHNATAAGVLLGTAAYMSPEQARGKNVDRRADVWAFGCVLYEMLTGKRLFLGETVSDTLAAVLTREPDYGLLPTGTPFPVRRALARCLERDPKKRFRDLGDVRIEMSEPVGVASEISAPTSPAPSRGGIALALALTTAAVIGAGISALFLRSTTALAPAASVYQYRIAISSPSFRGVMGSRVPSFAISPDGRWLVYRVGNPDGSPGSLYLRGLDELDARPLPGTEEGLDPFFSSDGRSIAFYHRGARQFYRMAVATEGSGPQPIAGKIESWRFLARGVWLDDGSIVYSTGAGNDLWRSPAGGGDPVRLVAPDQEGTQFFFPERVPGGSTVLYTAVDTNGHRIEAFSLESGERKVVTEGSFPKLSRSSRHLLFWRPPLPTLLAAPFDAERLELTGDAVPAVEGVSATADFMDFAVADNGTMVYRPAGAVPFSFTRPVIVDRTGRETTVFDRAGTWSEPRLSRDSRHLLLRFEDSPDCSLWLYDFGRDTLSRMTLERDTHSPAWIAGTGRIAFRDDHRDVIVTQRTDGSGTAQPIGGGAAGVAGQPQSVSPDGSTLLVTRSRSGSSDDLWIVPLDGAAAPRPFLVTDFSESQAVFSPDGRFVAYASDISGRSEIYVRPYPRPGAVYQVSNDGGEQPRWSGDGRELFYLSGRRMMAAATSLTPEFRAGRPGVVFESTFDTGPRSGSGNYDVFPDGQRFLMLKSAAQDDDADELHVILNWPELLKRRGP